MGMSQQFENDHVTNFRVVAVNNGYIEESTERSAYTLGGTYAVYKISDGSLYIQTNGGDKHLFGIQDMYGNIEFYHNDFELI
jgi:hypothetical protein